MPKKHNPNVRSESCSSCPYRCDVPSGVWASATYDMLIPYDEPTQYQPIGPFMCHATPDHYCHGWAVVGQSQPRDHHLLALRMFPPDDGVIPEARTPLFGSHTEAAEHGKREVDNPSDEAKELANRLVGKYDRLRWS